MRPVLVRPPVPFITLDEGRQQCRVDPDGENDVVVWRSIVAAISFLDGYRGILRRCIVNQEWRITLARPGRSVILPFPDISAIAVSFTDAPTGAVPFDIRDDQLAISFGTVPGRSIDITFTAGFGGIADVPQALKNAALMLVDFFYNQRGGNSDGPGFPPEVDVLISPYKVWRV